ncbi:MAG: DUF167 domain-containing protein, partial [Dehalococcoidales bacterium]|nr:DUF167 domain-containing protein [Dehalococcoidales bacterium]
IADKKATIEVHLRPGARTDEITALKERILYARVKAPPQKGQANRALLALLAETLGIAGGNLEILHGHTSRQKLIAVYGLGPEETMAKLSQALPQKEMGI